MLKKCGDQNLTEPELFDCYGQLESLPSSGRCVTPSPKKLLKSWFYGDQPASKRLYLIYISIAACFAAVTVALVITIFVGPPQVSIIVKN